MISTVTTSTVSTITTVALAGSIALIGIVLLLILLIQKEILTSSSKINLKRLSKALNVGIVPLFVAFFLTAVVKVIQVLN